MTCEEYLKLWNGYLDEPGEQGAVERTALEAHADSCASCRGLSHAFRLMASPVASPALPDGFADRVLSAWSESERAGGVAWRPILARMAWPAGLAAAAALLLLFVVPGRPGRDVASRPRPTTPTARPWTVALAEATSATLDLARETSAPAAKVGREVLDSTRPGDPAWPAAIDMAPSSSDVLQSVSKRVEAGVRPLSGSARRAFSFLAGPQPAPAKRPANPTGPSGA